MPQPQAAADTVLGPAHRASREITQWCGFSAEHERGSEFVVRPDPQSKNGISSLGSELKTTASVTEGQEFQMSASITEGFAMPPDLPTASDRIAVHLRYGDEVPPTSVLINDDGSLLSWRSLLTRWPVNNFVGPQSARTESGGAGPFRDAISATDAEVSENGCRAQFRDALSAVEGVLAMFTPRGGSLQSRIDSVHTSGALTARVTSGQESQSRPMNYKSILDRILDRLLFPAPTPSYDLSSFGNELLTLPRDDGEQVPCLFVKSSFSRFVFIYFHANAEDIGYARDFCIKMSTLFQVHVLTVEYPGYGLCSGKADEPGLQANAQTALRFVTESLRWPIDSVVIIGRSMGTGPAVSLAAKLPELGGLVLISPYTSIHNLIRHHVGSLAHLVTERFPSDQMIGEVNAPTLIIHGQQDALIPCAHGHTLFNLLRTKKVLVTPKLMGHNTALLRDLSWFVQPMFEFFPCPDYTFEDVDIPSWAFSGTPLPQQTRRDEVCSDNASTTASVISSSSSSGAAEHTTHCLKHPVSLAKCGGSVLTYASIVKPEILADCRAELAPTCDAEVSSSDDAPETPPTCSTTKLPTLLTTRPRVKPIANFIAK